jgi:hypothetical protein
VVFWSSLGASVSTKLNCFALQNASVWLSVGPTGRLGYEGGQICFMVLDEGFDALMCLCACDLMALWMSCSVCSCVRRRGVCSLKELCFCISPITRKEKNVCVGACECFSVVSHLHLPLCSFKRFFNISLHPVGLHICILVSIAVKFSHHADRCDCCAVGQGGEDGPCGHGPWKVHLHGRSFLSVLPSSCGAMALMQYTHQLRVSNWALRQASC